jgi:hypothetical protein
LVGEDANIPLTIENDYGKAIDGMFSYTIVQESNQGGFHYQSSNTQSKSYRVPEGKNTINIGFGTSSVQLLYC